LFLNIREIHASWVYGNKVLKRLFGHKRGKATGRWRKLLNEELNKLSALHQIFGWSNQGLGWAGRVVCLSDKKHTQHFGLKT